MDAAMEPRSLFRDFGDAGITALKAGFLGFGGSGKTTTAILLAIAAKKHFGHPGPIVMFDTENAIGFMQPLVKELTGQNLLGLQARSHADLMDAARECDKIGAACFVVDSITHPWRTLVEGFMEEQNRRRGGANAKARKNPSMADWQAIKREWHPWTEWYMNSRTSCIVAGRASWEYDISKDDDGAQQIDKVGVNMATEKEFGYEPNILVLLERKSDVTSGTPELRRRAIVMKDRGRTMDGACREFIETHDNQQNLKAVLEFFLPHLNVIKPKSERTQVSTDDRVHDSFGKYLDGKDPIPPDTNRLVALEELQAEMLEVFPGQTAADKKGRLDLMRELFGTPSWTAVERVVPLAKLTSGLAVLRERRKPLEVKLPDEGTQEPTAAK
jgi:hypothetical protein